MKKILSIIASAMLIASCTSQTEDLLTEAGQEQVNQEIQEQEIQEPEGQEVTLCASIALGDDVPAGPQCISGKDSDPGSAAGVINLTWDKEDKVLITENGNSSVFTLAGGEGTTKGLFKGVLQGDGSSYHVQYPAEYTDDSLTVQTYVENGFGRGLMKMSTKTPGNIADGFQLSADNALLGLQLTGADELDKIVLTNLANSKTYTLMCTGVELTSEVQVFYIVVPAGEWTNGFQVDVYATDETRVAVLKKRTSATFTAAKAMVMPTQALSSQYLSICNKRRIVFAPGNLQYHPKNQEWRFAPHQWDNIGTSNTLTNFKNPEYDDWLDLFCWSAEETNSGLDISADYSGNFVDWGNNTISGYAPNTWRTMTIDEWEYLLNGRPNATDLRAAAQVNGVNGWIFLPDNWTCPAEITFSPGTGYANNIFDIDQWLQIEEAGAIFLPSAGIRRGGTEHTSNTNSDGTNAYGRYWTSSTISNSGNPYYFYILNNDVWATYSTGRTHAQAVRLVRNL